MEDRVTELEKQTNRIENLLTYSIKVTSESISALREAVGETFVTVNELRRLLK